MYGSCCEEQDAQEAKVRARVAEIKRITEDRLMRGHKVRENMRRSMRPTHFGGCPDPCCDGCGGCDEDEVDGESGETDAAGDPSIRAKKANGAGEDGDESDSFDEDADEEAFMARMRAARLEQMRATAGTTAQRLSGHGVHVRLREDQPLSALLEDPTDDSPVIAHIAAGDGESEACLWVEDALRRAAPELPFARLVTDLSCSGGQPPDFLPFVCKLPVLLVVERGVVSSVCDTLGEHREPEAVRALISRWLANERVRLAEVATASARAAAAADDDDDDNDDDGPGSYCGRPGCRSYPHEHVGSKAMGGDGMPTPM
jgi:hypothetical protein